jgi:probable HAF family extracellular repeat protein
LGQIVGSYTDNSGCDHGFLFSGGSFTTIDDPNGVCTAGSGGGTWAQGINDAGQIVGYYSDAGGVIHGFLFSGGSFTTIDPFGSTYLWGINNAGQIVGASYNAQMGFIATPTSGPPPVAVDETATTNVGTAVTIDLAAGATGSPTSAAIVSGPAHGTIHLISPPTVFSYTPAAGFSGTDSFQFTLANAYGTSNTAKATITVTGGQILFNGNDITGTTQTVVVGEQIQLSAQLPNGDTSLSMTMSGPAMVQSAISLLVACVN